MQPMQNCMKMLTLKRMINNFLQNDKVILVQRIVTNIKAVPEKATH